MGRRRRPSWQRRGAAPVPDEEGWPVSTVGKALVSDGVVLQDEDVGVLERTFYLTWTGWSQLLDGSTVSGLGAEDVFAISGNDSVYDMTCLLYTSDAADE